jgi:hypothetical protein
MPTRKAPQPEEARKLFLTHPNRTLQQWANLWGTSAERVRQIRHESGVGAVFKVDMQVVNQVAEKISLGIFTLANRDLYKDLPVGFEAFKTWIRDNEEVQNIINEAQYKAKKVKLNPLNKLCILCKTEKLVQEFKKSQKYSDGYVKVCIECSANHDFATKVDRKTCFKCKKEKSKKSFTSNKNFKDGLVPFCKTCKSNMRRNKRTLNSKVTDNI